MAYIGQKPADKPLGASDITDGIISNSKLAQDIISAETELAEAPASTDEFLISDGGTLKRLDASYIGGANTPSFYAYASSGTSCSSGADTKIIFQTEIYDTDGKYDASTGRFTPTVAGKYFVATQIMLASAQDGANYQCILKKNGSVYAKSQDYMYGGDYSTNLSSVVDLDTDDYIETFVYHNSAGGTKNTNTADKYNFFSAFRIIT